MPTALNYGYYKPLDTENGTIFSPVLSDNWERISDHTHDGTDSSPIDITDIAKSTGTAPSGSWVADGARYKQDVDLPSNFTYETTNIIVMDNATKERIMASIEKVDSDTFTVYTNDNSLTYAFTYS